MGDLVVVRPRVQPVVREVFVLRRYRRVGRCFRVRFVAGLSCGLRLSDIERACYVWIIMSFVAEAALVLLVRSCMSPPAFDVPYGDYVAYVVSMSRQHLLPIVNWTARSQADT